MRCVVILCAVAIFGSVESPRQDHPIRIQPNEFAIGRHTFFDFGPPNDYYDIFLVGPKGTGSFVERVSLTPAVDRCFMPAKVEVISASIGASPAALLGEINPCAIPEKALRRERKRCKHCMVFSGADVAMQVQCGTQTRIIRSDILDKDIFDSNASTPQYTSWTMQLLARLDQAVGPGPMDKPMFQAPSTDQPTAPPADSPELRDISAGKYDSLFQGAPDKPSDLYRGAQVPPVTPAVSLESVTPFRPTDVILPDYPAIAELAHIQGPVAFRAIVDSSGAVHDISFSRGPMYLREPVEKAVEKWKFSQEAYNHSISAVVSFSLNCPAKSR